MEPEISTEMLKTLSEKLASKFPATASGYSIVQITRLGDTFLEFFWLHASQVEGQSLQQKEKKKKKRWKTKNKNHMPEPKCHKMQC